jgi:alkanesulfonate monooxygenase SsuD/methylene tetrahydromethanopterin reductase-like flavin-dependent oxidoreductase (luciferase family)
MHVGYGTGFQHLSDYPDCVFMREELGFCEMAESLGMDSVWATEHHFDNYSMSPDVLQLMSYLAGRTKRIRLGSMVIVLPWHDPMRVAEQVILLDHFSNGRFIMGIGRGLARKEFEGLRIEQSEARLRFREYAELLLTALETGVMEGGEMTRQPRREIRPGPYRSFKGRAFGAAASPESVPMIARLGLGLLIIPQKPWDLIRADFDVYHQTWQEVNGADSQPPSPFVSGFAFIDESADRAKELAYKYIGANYRKALEHYEMTSSHFGAKKSYEHYNQISQHLNAIGVDQATEDFVNVMPHGTPKQVLEQFWLIKEKIDMQGIMPNFNFGGMPYAEAERNLKCFVKHCMPEIKSWPATSSLEPVETAAA